MVFHSLCGTHPRLGWAITGYRVESQKQRLSDPATSKISSTVLGSGQRKRFLFLFYFVCVCTHIAS